jgi:hypothetical protein
MAEADVWCEGDCKTHPENNAIFLDDGNKHAYEDKEGNTYICSKHHWQCSACNKIVQVG